MLAELSGPVTFVMYDSVYWFILLLSLQIFHCMYMLVLIWLMGMNWRWNKKQLTSFVKHCKFLRIQCVLNIIQIFYSPWNGSQNNRDRQSTMKHTYKLQ